MVFPMDDLLWRAWATMNDSILWWKTAIVNYDKESLLLTRALYNIDKEFDFPLFNKMVEAAIKEDLLNSDFYKNATKGIEVQIIWDSSEQIRTSLSYEEVIKKYFIPKQK